MKEIQMFPQITEETEENLLTLDEGDELLLQQAKDGKSPSPLSSEYSSAVTSPVDGVLPSRNALANDENLLVPKIVAEYVDSTVPKSTSNNGKFVTQDGNGEIDNDEFSSPPPRVRMRSLSGGTYRLSPAPPVSGRMRRQSGDDVLTGASPSRRAAFLDNFRPRSKSDSKGKKPNSLLNFLLRNSNSQQQQNAVESRTSSPSEHWPRARSGSESKSSGPMSKMIDMFRSRSNSISIDQRTKKSNSATPLSAFMRRYSVDPERRRHPMITTHRSLELPLDHQHPLHQSLRKRSEASQDIDFQESPLVVSVFFEACKCEQVMPLSGKVVVLEKNLKVERAFYCLVEHVIRAAPIWDSSKMQFVGMLTITDFIDVLLYYNSKQEEFGDFENQKICTWRSLIDRSERFIHVAPETSLTEAVKTLIQEKVHRLPIYDPKTETVLYILTLKKILRFFHQWGLGKNQDIAAIFPKPRFITKSIRELKIGTYRDLQVATYSMTVIDALKIFREKKISAMPIVNENYILIDVYAKFDAFALATRKSYHNLKITLREALLEESKYQDILLTCTLDDTLQYVLEKIVDSEVHRIFVVTPKRALVGVITLSDILTFLVLNPTGIPATPPNEKDCATKVSEEQEVVSSNETTAEAEKASIGDAENIPFVESTDEDDVFGKSQSSSADDAVVELGACSECTMVEEETLEEALDKVVIS